MIEFDMVQEAEIYRGYVSGKFTGGSSPRIKFKNQAGDG
jgi:hypothetical protein